MDWLWLATSILWLVNSSLNFYMKKHYLSILNLIVGIFYLIVCFIN